MSSVSGLAQVIYDDLEPPSVTVLGISGWLDNNIGKLNIALDECYTTVSGDFTPAFDNQLSGIYQELYKLNYYQKQIRYAVNGVAMKGTGSAIDWVELREGDSVIRRANPAELARIYSAEKREVESNLRRLVAYYNSNRAKPDQIVGNEWEDNY